MEEISQLTAELRQLLIEYRYLNRLERDSVHVNAIEIALCLSEYLIEKKRAIQQSEVAWFEAQWYVIQLFEGSEYQGLADKYLKLCQLLKEKKLILGGTGG